MSSIQYKKKPIFALVDCNNFYASCQSAFDPRLEGEPVVVLSNNDGCIIARSNEAKKLGIPMGAPFFKWKAYCLAHKVHIFSSNYELYGDMSRRVMLSLKEFCPDVEIYSIDEAFLALEALTHQDLTAYASEIRNKIKQWLGIPISIGIGPTKTLAKIANYIAKHHKTESVYNFFSLPHDDILAQFPLVKIWGIGTALAKKLALLNIKTAKDLRDADQKMIRMHFGVTVERIVQELRGASCISLDTVQPRKQIISSRSFGQAITELWKLEEAISHYTHIASSKLRKQKSLASAMVVFVQTNIFRENEARYENSFFFPFPEPTADTSYLIRIAKKCLKQIYKKGFKYHKAGIILIDLISPVEKNTNFFSVEDPKKELLMASIDSINRSLGKESLFYAAEGVARSWQMRRDKCSPHYTTEWEDLVKVYCR